MPGQRTQELPTEPLTDSGHSRRRQRMVERLETRRMGMRIGRTRAVPCRVLSLQAVQTRCVRRTGQVWRIRLRSQGTRQGKIPTGQAHPVQAHPRSGPVRRHGIRARRRTSTIRAGRAVKGRYPAVFFCSAGREPAGLGPAGQLGRLSPHLIQCALTFSARRVGSIVLNEEHCISIDRVASVPGSQVPECAPEAKSSLLQFLQINCINLN